MADRLLASVFVGLMALMAALNAGLPLYRHLPIGDASDFGICGAFATWFAIKVLHHTVIINNIPRDSDGTATAAVCEDIPAPQGCQARAESIAQKQKP